MVRGAGGFVLDVVLDPTTYLTGGLGGVSRKAAGEAADMAAVHGADEATQEAIRSNVRKAAEVHAAKHLEQRGRGIKVGLRFHVPFTDVTAHPQGIVPGTRAIGHSAPVRAVRRKVRDSGAVQRIAGNLAPDFRPAGVTPLEHQAVRAAERRLRAAQGITKERAAATKRSLRKAVPDAAKQADVIAAVERAPVNPLTDVESRVVRTKPYEARLKARAAKRKVETARRAELHARGRAEVAASAASHRTIREALAEADRHANTVAKGGEVSPHKAAADQVLTDYKAASKIRNRASTELSNAGKAYRNAHQNAPELYTDAERATNAARLDAAKKQMAHAKIEYDHAKASPSQLR
jgi:hypothetical protein